MKQMQGLDAAFVAMEQPGAPVHVGSLLIYDPSTAPDGFVRFKDILSFIEGRLQLAESMRQKMVKVPFGIDYPYWINDSQFDLEYHVRHISLPEPNDWRQLCILAARIFARPLDMTRPPWEITVVGGLDNVEGVPKGSFAMLSKMHHAAIDGASGVDMMLATHTMNPHTDPLTTPDNFRPEANPSQVGMFVRGYARSLTHPWRQLNASRKAIPGAIKAARGLIRKDYDFNALLQTPKTRFNGVVSPHRMFDGVTFDLADVKMARNLCKGATVNDVMLSVVGGAMRRYLEAKEELPDTSVTAMAPISVRSESEKNTMGNQVSAMFVPLGSHVATATARMAYVHEETTKAKTFTNAFGARQTAEMAKLSPAPIMNIGASLYHRLKIADYQKPFINTVVTNVPGPPIPLYSGGAKLVGMFGQLCLVDGVRLGHVVHSYVDKMTVGFMADRDVMPDPSFYAECMRESFEEHINAAKVIDKQLALKAAKQAKADEKTAKAAPKPKSKPKSAKSVKTTTVRTAKPVKPSANGGNGSAAKPS